MYKAQFAKWGWSKYNSKRLRRDISSGKSVEKSHGKSCRRVRRRRGALEQALSQVVENSQDNQIVRRPTTTAPPGFVLQMTHESDAARNIEAVLADIRSHVFGFYTRKREWIETPETGLISAYNYGFYESFRVAMDNFLMNEHTNGGEMIRRAFLEVEDAVNADYTTTFYFLFIDLPDLFLDYGRHDILTILLGHISKLASVKLRDKILGHGFTSLHALVRQNPAMLRHYIGTASLLWTDLLQQLRGPQDRSTLLAKRNYLRHSRSIEKSRMEELCQGYYHLLTECQAVYGEKHSASQHLEDIILLIQFNYDMFLDDFEKRNQRLITDICNKYGGQTSASPNWDILDRNIYSNCFERLGAFYTKKNEMQRAIICQRKAHEGWRTRYWHIEVERALAATGRIFECETVRKCRLESQYFRRLPDNATLQLKRPD